ncbi:MAG: doubled protein [Bacillales bacterium]|jgi:predicted CXXCH cytochrome family protein|nr:doubled protein [Bacillales bacterium]
MKKLFFALTFIVGMLATTSSAFAFHYEFAANTNSCASCHELHGSSSDMLLSSDLGNGSAACLSCHDQTSSYGVMATNSNAGAFDVTLTGKNGTTAAAGSSMHNIGATAKLSDAPGGNKASTGEWGGSFGCTSCHNGHKEYGTPNKISYIKTSIIDAGTDTKAVDLRDYSGNMKIRTSGSTTSTTSPDPNGIPGRDDVNYQTKPAERYILVQTNVANVAKGALTKPSDIESTTDFVTDVAGKTETVGVQTWVLVPYVWVGPQNSYKAVTPAMSGKIKVDGIENTTDLAISADGYIYAKTVAGSAIIKNPVKVISGVTVKFNVDPYTAVSATDAAAGKFTSRVVDNNSYWNSASSHYKYGSGTELTLYCLQCHTDYMSSSHGSLNTVYGTASYKHSNVKGDSYSCTRCHFAHGTNYSLMRDAEGRNVSDLTAKMNAGTPATYHDKGQDIVLDTAVKISSYMKETSSSTALKRQVGFSVCLNCHGTDVGNPARSTYSTTANW